MIIKLTDGDVTVAQDSLDDAGIIHIPENVWDHIVQEVQHPDQSFVNELYINVQDLNIDSGDHKIQLTSAVFSGTVLFSDFTVHSSGSVTIPAGNTLVLIKEYADYYQFELTMNQSGNDISRSVPHSGGVLNAYYHIWQSAAGGTTLGLKDEIGDTVVTFTDTVNTDTYGNRVNVFKKYFNVVV